MEKRTLATAQWHNRFIQQSVWTSSIRNYLFKKASLMPNDYILEVGCGTCAVLSEARDKSSHIFGIDIDFSFLEFGKKIFPSLHLAQGDGQVLPYRTDVFDIVYCHYLLLWIEDPIRIIQEFKRVGKPGAKLIILAEPDYGGRIDYPPPLEALGNAQTSSLLLQGADPIIGRKISSIANSLGLKNIEFGVLGSQSVTQIEQCFLESEWEIINSDLADQLTEKELFEYQEIDNQAWQNGTRVLFVPTFYLYAEI